MINRALFNLTGRLPCRLIKPDGRPYLERYYVGQLFGVTFYLHRFVSADSERHVHTHPWTRGGSVILAGSYTEEIATDLCPHAGPAGSVLETRRVRWFNAVGGSRFHRISDAAPGTWSLFFHGERARVNLGMTSKPKGWGFLEQGHLLGFQAVTVFKPYASTSPLEWWHDAPTGAAAGREGL